MFVKFPSNPGSDGAHRSSQRCHTCTGLRIIVNIWKQLFLSCDPPIIHGNLTCDTIFIQHNGLVKIGSVAPDAIHKNVKTFRENIKNFHFLAPEWAGNESKSISCRAPNGLKVSEVTQSFLISGWDLDIIGPFRSQFNSYEILQGWIILLFVIENWNWIFWPSPCISKTNSRYMLCNLNVQMKLQVGGYRVSISENWVKRAYVSL